MANSKQARKRARQAEQHRLGNASKRSEMRTYLKNVVKALDKGDLEAAKSAYELATPKIDSAVGKGLMHKNKAARHKSRLNAKIKSLAS